MNGSVVVQSAQRPARLGCLRLLLFHQRCSSPRNTSPTKSKCMRDVPSRPRRRCHNFAARPRWTLGLLCSDCYLIFFLCNIQCTTATRCPNGDECADDEFCYTNFACDPLQIQINNTTSSTAASDLPPATNDGFGTSSINSPGTTVLHASSRRKYSYLQGKVPGSRSNSPQEFQRRARTSAPIFLHTCGTQRRSPSLQPPVEGSKSQSHQLSWCSCFPCRGCPTCSQR